MRILKVMLFGCLALLPIVAQDRELPRKTAVIASFYKAALLLPEPGVPSEAQLKKLTPFLSKAFIDRLTQARKAEEDYLRKTRGEVPPLIESFLFYSLFEGANQVGAVRPEENAPTFLVELGYSDSKGATYWKDRSYLVKEGGRWVLDDIELLGDWEFGAKGRVSAILDEAIRTAAATPEP